MKVATRLFAPAIWAGLSIGCAARVGHAQNIEQVRDRPFIAVAITRSDGRVVRNGQGRSATGSWFRDKAGPQGVLEWRQIKDVTNRQIIDLNFQLRQYIVHQLPLPEINFRTYSISEWLAEQSAIETQWIRTGQALGHRLDNGFALVGFTTTNGSQRTDRWEAADLGATYSYTVFFSGSAQTTWELTDIRAEEPEPSLFTIPQGFTPAIVRIKPSQP